MRVNQNDTKFAIWFPTESNLPDYKATKENIFS